MNKYGKCHLCGKEGKLTFEHLPPEKANNNREAHAIVGDVLMEHIGGTKDPWDLNGLRYKNLQRGMGGYTLCSECNNNTGNWYANDYINFVNTIGYVLNNKINLEKTEAIHMELKEMYPLRIIKQILCMFVSTMHPQFLDAHPDLREFIMNKESNNFDIQKYRISMYILKEPHNGWSGLTVMMYANNKMKTVAYMDLYPVGYILEINPTEDKFNCVLDISNMATDFSYDFRGIMGITLNILERNSFFVGDFRTKEEIKSQVLINKQKTIEVIKQQMEELKINENVYSNIVQEYLENKISAGEFDLKIEEIKKQYQYK